MPEWLPGLKQVLVQRKVKGLRYNLDFASLSGELMGFCQSVVYRVDTADYSGVAVDLESVPLTPKLEKYARALIREIGYSGIGLIQFLHEPDENEFYLLELNPRLGAPVASSYYSGFDVPAYALAVSDGQRPQSIFRGPKRRGVRCVWTTGDLHGLLHAANHRETSPAQLLKWGLSLTSSFMWADRHCTWSWSDPMPSLFESGRIVREAVTRLTSRAFGRGPGMRSKGGRLGEPATVSAG